MHPPPRLFCFGLGYCAERLARRLQPRGFAIAGTTRDVAARREALAEPSWSLYAFDGSEPMANAEAALAGTTHLLHSIMPDEQGDPVLRWHAEQIAALPDLIWIGYLSTTGVYGDHDGAWVNEDTPRHPSLPRTRRRKQAEDAWLERGARVFRLAGIYGPGRSALERVATGEAQRIIKPGKLFNRIHVDDVVTVLEASIEQTRIRAHEGRAYNVADGNPASSAEVLEYAAELLGVVSPPAVSFEEAELSDMARSFWQDDVRVSNERIVQELGVELAYPDYRAGLQALAQERASELREVIARAGPA
ncbi:MAG: SDR family oxidoreductase [Enhygromyxa sp.]